MFSILIVDDEPYIREGMKKLIPWAQVGVTDVFTAASAKQALDILCQQSINVIITDIRMQEMDGIELITQVNSMCPGTRVIVVTGYDEFEYARACLRLRVNDFLIKPVDEDELLSIVGRLREHSVQDGFEDEQLITPDKAESIVSRAKDYVRSHLAEDLSVAKIAQAFFVSPTYLSRLFKRTSDEGCNQFIVRMRMEKACALLKGTDLPVGEIAAMVGYKDQNYFSLAFKKQYGASPNTFRKV